MHERLEACPVKREDPPELGRRAWELAERFGWGRTYYAKYVARAQILDCRLVTIDAPLRLGADQLGIMIGLDELARRSPTQAGTNPSPNGQRKAEAHPAPRNPQTWYRNWYRNEQF